jgi:sugar phosphate isomerase/epimerase
MTRPGASPHPLRRRDVLKVAGGAALGGFQAAVALAAGPVARTGKPRFLVGLAAYSFRQYFEFSRGERQEPPGGREPLDMAEFVDFCAEHDAAAELTSYFFPPEVGDGNLRDLKRHAFLRGVPVAGTAVGNDFAHPDGETRREQIAYVKSWVDRAAVLGAPHIRVFAGPQKPGLDPAESKRLCVSALQECCDYAGTKGVLLGLENHGGIVAEAADLLEIVEAVDSPWFGVNLDTGNFHTRDPYGDLARCAPYAVNVQVKVEIRPADGGPQPVDLARVAGILRDGNYQGFVTLEYEAEDDPFTAVPEWLGRLRAALSNPT